MFNAYSFTFAGVSSEVYGLHVYDFGGQGQKPVSFGNKASIVETRLIHRVQPIHYGVNYHASPLEFTLTFGSLDEALDRFDMEEIALWLTGHGDYQWLSIDQHDLEHCQFRCIITQLTPIHHGWLPYAFEASVQCDCPYAYGYPFEQTESISENVQKRILFRNEGSCHEYLRPLITFSTSGENSPTAISIVNQSDNGRLFRMEGIPASTQFFVDCNNGMIYDNNPNNNFYNGFNMVFPRFVMGDNELTVTSDKAVDMTISGRFLYNVAG